MANGRRRDQNIELATFERLKPALVLASKEADQEPGRGKIMAEHLGDAVDVVGVEERRAARIVGQDFLDLGQANSRQQLLDGERPGASGSWRMASIVSGGQSTTMPSSARKCSRIEIP